MSEPISESTIEQYFRDYGWSFESLSGGLWRTGFKGDNASFTVFLRLTDSWLYMTISPFVPKPESEASRHRVFEAMLHFNREMNLAKFVLDEDNDITLAVELPQIALAYPAFSEGLTALAYYADDIHPELLALARGDQLLSRFSATGGAAKSIQA